MNLRTHLMTFSHRLDLFELSQLDVSRRLMVTEQHCVPIVHLPFQHI